jgi:hypothetical protein
VTDTMHPYRVQQRKRIVSSLYDRLYKSEFRTGRLDLPSRRFINDVLEVLAQEQPLSRDEMLALYRVKLLKCMHAKFKKCAKLPDIIADETRTKALRSIRTLNDEIFRLSCWIMRHDSKESYEALRVKLGELKCSIQNFPGYMITEISQDP